jgi:hypothetical protein
VITCPNCGKDNQDRHKFCLGCGARLPAGAPGYPASVPGPSAGPPPPPPPRPAVPPPPPPVGAHGPPPGPAVVGLAAPPGPPPPPPPPLPDPMAAGAPPRPSMSGPTAAGVAAAPSGGPCATCGFANPPGFAFCGRCGQRLGQDPAPVAQVEDVGSANTVFVSDAPAELRQAAQAFRGDPAGTVPSPADGEFAPVSTAAGQPGPPSGPPPAPPSVPPPAPPPSSSTEPGAQGAAPRGGTVPNPAIPPAAAVIGVAAKLIMLGPDGQPLGERLLSPGETLEIGRDAGPPWDEDAYLDRKHGSLIPGADGIEVVDHGSLNGIFVKLHERAELQDGDQFRVGQELLIYEDLPEPTPTDDGTERMGSPNPGYWGRLSLLVDPDSASAAYPIHGEGLTVGRENGDITFPGDGYVSGTHCRIYGDDNGVYVEDVGSSNGTYMRVRSGARLPYGSLVLIGQKLFQFERQ